MVKNEYLHGLRGVLAFALLIFHVVHSGLPAPEGLLGQTVSRALHTFNYGVEVFFAISGFVIYKSFRRAASPGKFMLGRVVRIFPVLWSATLLIYVALPYSSKSFLSYDLSDLFFSLFALRPLFPGPIVHPAAWSIGYEFIFYTGFVIAHYIRLWCGSRAALFSTVLLVILFVIEHNRAASFFVGLAVVLLPAPFLLRSFSRCSGLWIILSLTLFSVTYDGLSFWNGLDSKRVPQFPALAIAAYISALTALYIGFLGAVHGQGTFGALLKTRAVQWLGSISFSLYMWQTLVMAVVKALMHKTGVVVLLGHHAQLGFFLLAVGPVLAVSWVSYEVLEKRGALLLKSILLPSSSSHEGSIRAN